jgi:hypothetical protein
VAVSRASAFATGDDASSTCFGRARSMSRTWTFVRGREGGPATRSALTTVAARPGAIRRRGLPLGGAGKAPIRVLKRARATGGIYEVHGCGRSGQRRARILAAFRSRRCEIVEVHYQVGRRKTARAVIGVVGSDRTVRLGADRVERLVSVLSLRR